MLVGVQNFEPLQTFSFGQPFKKLCTTLSGDRYFLLVAHQNITTFCFVDFEDVVLVDKVRFVDPEKT